jgi:hypothetical protein
MTAQPIMKNLTPSSNPNPNPQSNIEDKIAHERIRQARNASNLALIATAVSTAISLFGAIDFLADKGTQGAVTTAGGLAASLQCIRFAKDSNDRLDKLLAEIAD